MNQKPPAFDAFCREAFAFLEASGVRYLVIGGLAVMAIGEARLTADADVVAYLTERDADALIQKAKSAGFDVDPGVERKRLEATGTLRFVRGAFRLDIILASLPFEEVAYARAVEHRLFGHLVKLPTPEDLLLFKILAGRDKDLLDAEGVARRHAGRVDWSYVEGTIRELCDLAEDMSAWQRLERVRARAVGA